MSSAFDGQAIIDKLFGCCLGHGRRRAGQQRGGEGNDVHDEQTPLLSGRSKSSVEIGQAQSSSGRAAETGTSSKAGGVGGEQAKTSGDKQKRRKQIDSTRLKAIRDQTQAAIFHVESSQLLPSSSSLAQHQASIGSSQKLNRRDRSRERTGTDEEPTYTERQRKELIAASDQAERLYRAAMKTEERKYSVSSAEDKNVSTSALTPPSSSSSSEQVAPVGLVRQVRLSVRDTSKQTGLFKAQQTDSSDTSIPAAAIQTTKVSPSRPTFTVQPGSLSPASTSHESNAVSVGHGMHKLPSIHSLRTLRLGILPTSSSGDGLDEDLMFGRSAQSHASDSVATNEGDKHTVQSTDDERWEQRGRTRSRRGLVWMDASTREELTNDRLAPHSEKLKVSDVWKRDDQRTGTEAAEKTDEIQYGLRFDVQHAAAKRNEITKQLDNSSTLPVAELWDDSVSVTDAS